MTALLARNTYRVAFMPISAPVFRSR